MSSQESLVHFKSIAYHMLSLVIWHIFKRIVLILNSSMSRCQEFILKVSSKKQPLQFAFYSLVILRLISPECQNVIDRVT